jgi:lactoylglutathione lyase
MCHICLGVPDIEVAKSTLEARPARKNYPRDLEFKTGVNRRRQPNLFDPGGTRVEPTKPRRVDGTPRTVLLGPP